MMNGHLRNFRYYILVLCVQQGLLFSFLFVLLRLLPDISFFTICNLWGLLLFVSFVICANDDVDDTLRHHQDHHHHLHCLSCSSFVVIRNSVSRETWERRMSTLLNMLLVEEDDDRKREEDTFEPNEEVTIYTQTCSTFRFLSLSLSVQVFPCVWQRKKETLESESNHSLSAKTSTWILLIPSFFSHWFLSLLLFTVRHVLSEGKANLIKRQKNFLFVSTKELDLYWQWKAAVDVLAASSSSFGLLSDETRTVCLSVSISVCFSLVVLFIFLALSLSVRSASSFVFTSLFFRFTNFSDHNKERATNEFLVW